MKYLILGIVLLSSCKKYYQCCSKYNTAVGIEALNKQQAQNKCEKLTNFGHNFELCE